MMCPSESGKRESNDIEWCEVVLHFLEDSREDERAVNWDHRTGEHRTVKCNQFANERLVVDRVTSEMDPIHEERVAVNSKKRKLPNFSKIRLQLYDNHDEPDGVDETGRTCKTRARRAPRLDGSIELSVSRDGEIDFELNWGDTPTDTIDRLTSMMSERYALRCVDAEGETSSYEAEQWETFLEECCNEYDWSFELEAIGDDREGHKMVVYNQDEYN